MRVRCLGGEPTSPLGIGSFTRLSARFGFFRNAPDRRSRLLGLRGLGIILDFLEFICGCEKLIARKRRGREWLEI